MFSLIFVTVSVKYQAFYRKISFPLLSSEKILIVIRMRYFFALLLVFSFLLGEEARRTEPLPLATTEGISSAVVAGCVNAISGNYFECHRDLVVAGAEPLPLERYYFGSTYVISSMQHGWQNNFSSHALIWKAGSDWVARYVEPHGSSLYFKEGKFNHDVNKRGLTNCGAEHISGQTNLKNHKFFHNKKTKEMQVITGAGNKRTYHMHHPKSTLLHEISGETLPHGNFINYTYDNKGKLVKVNTNTNHLTFKGEEHLEVTASDGRKVKYHFSKIVPTAKEKKELNCYERFLLTEVQAPGKLERYEYIKSPGGFYDFLSKKVLPDGRFISVNYYFDQAQKALNRRVKSLSAPVGTDGSPVVTHRFKYHIKTDLYGYLTDAGYTEVLDALNQKTLYHFSKDERLTGIETFGEKGLFSAELFVWGEGADETHLKAHLIQNGKRENLAVRKFHYDQQGNVLEETLKGSLTGEGKQELTTHYTYSHDGFNLPLTKQDLRKKEIFTYKPGTNLKTATLTEANGKIVKREFCFYNHDGVLTQKISDDGSKKDVNDLNGVTERHITLITPRTEAPIGLPQIEEEYYLVDGKKQLLKKTVNTHSPEGWLLKREIYDSNHAFCYAEEWKYNLRGQVIYEKDPIGQVIARKYDANGNLIHEQGPRQDFHKVLAYDCANRLIREEEVYTNGLRLTIHHQYNLLGQKIASTDIYGHTTHYQYDRAGRVIETLMPPFEDVQAVVKTTYDGLGHKLSENKGKGTTHFKCNYYGKPFHIHYPDGSEESFEYDLDGLLVKEVAKNGSYTVYENDYQGRVIKKTVYGSSGELLSATSATYNAFHLLTETDAAGKVTFYSYDKAGRLIEKRKNDQILHFAYDALGREIERREHDVVYLKSYDFLNRVIAETVKNSAGKVLEHKEMGYDEMGNIKQCVTFPEAKKAVQTFTYNAHNQLLSSTDPEGHTTFTRYDYNWRNEQGQKVAYEETTDPLGQVSIKIYNAVGKVAQEIRKNPLGQITQIKESFYDASLNRTRFTIEGVATAWEYDALDRVTQITEAEQKITRYTYNLAGQKETIVKPDGVTLKHTYDAKGRLKTAISSDQTVEYHYSYDPLDNPVLVEDRVHHTATRRTYDDNNRLAREELASGLTLHYSYDPLGHITRVELPDGSSQEATWDGLHLAEVRRYDAKRNLNYLHRYLSYDLAGHVLEEELPLNLGQRRYHYDLLGRTTHILAPSYDEQLSYDAAGNLVKKELTDPLGSITCHYSFDDLYQLKSEEGMAAHTYEHDGRYNRIACDNHPSPHNALNQLLATATSTYSYDPNGNLSQETGAQNLKLTYDALDRLIQVTTDQGTYTYTYDDKNRRLTKTSPVATTLYLYLNQNEIGACNAAGELTEYRLLGHARGAEIGGALAIEANSQLYIPTHDIQGSLVLLHTPSGTLATRYSAFGEPADKPLPTPWTFSSKRLDSETGFLNFGRRYYNPSTARWITPDPLGLDAGPNLYAYVLNSPLTHFDAYGLLDFPTFNRDYGLSAIKGMGHGVIDFSVRSLHDFHSAFAHIGAGQFEMGWHERAHVFHSIERVQANQMAALESRVMSFLSVDPSDATYQTYRHNTTLGLEVGTLAVGGYGVAKGAIRATRLARASSKITHVRQLSKVISRETSHLTLDLDALADAGKIMDRGGLTRAGRALDKHGNRPGSIFPQATGNPAAKNAQGQFHLEDILTDPSANCFQNFKPKYGNVIDVRIPDGKGARFSSDGNFIMFLEP